MTIQNIFKVQIPKVSLLTNKNDKKINALIVDQI